jgi:poly(3-hydroxybutyrate) depolymerase
VVPKGYADLAPAPLILRLASGTGRLDPAFERWRPYLDPVESIFVVAELGGFSHRQSSTLTALIDQLVAAYCIDPRRVHALGASSSGPVVAALACDASVPIASFSAGMGFFPPLCASPRPLPLMAITGDVDRAPVSTSVERWAESNGCDAEPVDEDLGSGVTRKTYQGCDADVVLYDIEGAGHGFIRQECLGTDFDDCIKTEVFDELVETERFFAEHPLPAE